MLTRFLVQFLVAALVVLAPFGSRAQGLSDHWYSPGEPGWGLSIQHQRNALFLVLFLFSEAPADGAGKGEAQWFVAPDARLEVFEHFSYYHGKLYSVRGSPLTAPFDPAATQATEVGEITIAGDDMDTDGIATYRIGSTQRTKAIRRMSFAAPELGGTYLVTLSGFVSRSSEDSVCRDLPPGLYTRRETWTVAPDGADGWRLTRRADDVPATVQPLQVRQRGSKLEMRLRIAGVPVTGEGLVDLDAQGHYGWTGSFHSFSDETVTLDRGGRLHPVPQCRFDGSLAAARAIGQD